MDDPAATSVVCNGNDTDKPTNASKMQPAPCHMHRNKKKNLRGQNLEPNWINYEPAT